MEGKVCDYFYESKTDSLKAYSKVPIRKKDEGIRGAGDSFASLLQLIWGNNIHYQMPYGEPNFS